MWREAHGVAKHTLGSERIDARRDTRHEESETVRMEGEDARAKTSLTDIVSEQHLYKEPFSTA
jgi:hypothetical protein